MRSASIIWYMNHNTIYITDNVNVFIKASFINDRPLKIFVNRISVEIAYKRWQELDSYKPLKKLKKTNQWKHQTKHQLQYQLKIHLQPTTTMVNSKIISSVDTLINQNSVKNFRLRSKRSRKEQSSHLVSCFCIPSVPASFCLSVRCFLVFDFQSHCWTLFRKYFSEFVSEFVSKLCFNELKDCLSSHVLTWSARPTGIMQWANIILSIPI